MAKFKWTVEFTVDEVWVADGFEIDKDRALDMIATTLPHSVSTEFNARIIAKPPADKIARAQGYKSAADRRRRENRK